MPTVNKKVKFIDSEEGAAVKEQLRIMAASDMYNTDSTYSANGETYPNHLIPFVDKHMNYLNVHPDLDPQQYVSNLRLMTRVR